MVAIMTSPLLHFQAQTLSRGSSSFEFPEIEIEQGDIVGLFGLTGSGKALLIRILAGLIEIPKPAIFHGENTGFIFHQNGILSHHTLLENIVMPIWFSKSNRTTDQIEDCLTRWNLKDLQDNHMNSLSPQVIKITQYARCDLLNPDIVFVERPNQGLTTEQRKLVNAWVEQYISQGGALIYTDENHHTFQSMSPRVVRLGGGNQRLRTILNLG